LGEFLVSGRRRFNNLVAAKPGDIVSVKERAEQVSAHLWYRACEPAERYQSPIRALSSVAEERNSPKNNPNIKGAAKNAFFVNIRSIPS
jgi:hypothetical protein